MKSYHFYNHSCMLSAVYAQFYTHTVAIFILIKGCDSNFEVYFLQILKVATNETTT